MKKKFIFLCSAFAILAVTAFATFANRSGASEIVYDFSVFNAETDLPVNAGFLYTEGEWGNIANDGQIESVAINSRLANIKWSTSGSSRAVIWQLYSTGMQVVMNQSGVTAQFTEASVGDEIIFYATSNRDAQFGDYTIAKNAEYANYTFTADADAPTMVLPRGLTIRTITIKKGGAAPAGKTWDMTAITEADMQGYVKDEGNLTGTAYAGDPNAWAALNNNAAFEGELMKNATEPFGPTAGLTFKANGSKWVLVRFYPEEYGGFHICSNNKDLQMNIPAGAGKTVIMKIGGNGGTITTLAGATEESVTTTKTYDYYMWNTTADIVSLKLFKNCYIQKITVLDAAPTQADADLKVNPVSVELNAEETAQLEYTSKNDIAPVFTSSDDKIAKVDATGKITGVSAGTATITVSQGANPYFKAASVEIPVKVKTAGETALDKLIAAAIATAENGAATIELAEGGEYTLDAEAVCDTINVTIEGNKSKIVVGENGAFSAKQGLTIKNVKFDAAQGKVALIQLPKMTTAADSVLYNLHGANGKNAFFNEKAITLENVSVSELTTALIANADRWCVKNVNIKNSIFQLNASSGKFIDFQAGGGDGMIKNINIEGSTFYNLQANDGLFFLAYNTSKPMPEKFYGAEDNTCTWTMTNNTFAQAFKQMSDRYTENKVATVKWVNNIWSGHTNLTKTRNCTFEMTAADNSGDGGANLGSFGTKENLQIAVPETAYDFNEDALIPYFSLFKRTMAYEFRMGDTRWLVAGKVAADRTWDFANNATNHADDWALIKADATNWGQVKEGQEVRYQNIVKIDTAEAVVLNGEQAQKVKFLEGLTWIADAKKLIVGDGSGATYACLQLQKGCQFSFDNVYAGDTILFTACNTGKNPTEDCVKFAEGYPAIIGLSKAGEYTTDTIIALKAGKFEVEMAADTRLQKIEVRPYAGDYTYPQLAAALNSGKTHLRLNVADVDTVTVTTKNEMVPVLFTSSDEAVATVDANGEIKAVAPGVAYITIDQAAGGIYYGMVKKIFVQVMPELAFHQIAVNYESEKCETVYSPDAIAAVAKADNNDAASYYITPEYATWMYFNNGNNGDNVVIAKEPNNAWMKIDFREGANDSICHMACPVSEKNGTAACYNPSSGGGFAYSMDYYVTGVEKVKFYYHTSASKAGGLRLQVFENTAEGEPIDTQAGVSDQKGKGANGQSFTVSLGGLEKDKKYIIRALREGDGDVLVYAAKFYTEENFEAEDATVTLADAGYATFYDSKLAYEIPEGFKAFVVTEATTEQLTYAELTGIIPAGTAVMLESANKTGGQFAMKASRLRTKYTGANLLNGSDEETTTFAEGESLFYKLAYGKSGSANAKAFGWFWGADNGAAFQIEAHRAWLAIPQQIAAPSYLIGGSATGISSTVAERQDNAEFYNLQGQRTDAPSKGIYIHNNKKVVVK